MQGPRFSPVHVVNADAMLDSYRDVHSMLHSGHTLRDEVWFSHKARSEETARYPVRGTPNVQVDLIVSALEGRVLRSACCEVCTMNHERSRGSREITRSGRTPLPLLDFVFLSVTASTEFTSSHPPVVLPYLGAFCEVLRIAPPQLQCYRVLSLVIPKVTFPVPVDDGSCRYHFRIQESVAGYEPQEVTVVAVRVFHHRRDGEEAALLEWSGGLWPPP